MKTKWSFGIVALLWLLTACSSNPPMPTVAYVDIPRFMGDWYVIANIPTFIEVGAHNAVESYALQSDGTIATTFRFRDGSFSGEEKSYFPQGFIRNTTTNAEWGMQFIWPIKAEYKIVWLKPDYSQVVIGRSARDFVWIMARTPQINAEEYAQIITTVESLGYDISKLQLVPQQWPQQQVTP